MIRTLMHGIVSFLPFERGTIIDLRLGGAKFDPLEPASGNKKLAQLESNVAKPTCPSHELFFWHVWIIPVVYNRNI